MTTPRSNAKTALIILILLLAGIALAVFTLKRQPAGPTVSSAPALPPESEKIKDGALVYDQFKAGYSQGQRDFVVPPGKYTFPPEFTSFALDAFNDATISAYGATFVLNNGGFVLAHCRNTILRGLVLENDPAPFMQGVIKSIDHAKKTLDVEFDPAFHLPTPQYPNEGQHLILQYFTPDGTRNIPMEWEAAKGPFQKINDTVFRIQLLNNRIFTVADSPDVVSPGFQLSLAVDSASFGFEVVDGENVTLEDARVYAVKAYGFFDHDGKGGNTYRRCVIGRKPGSKLLAALGRDGFHCYRDQRGPLIEYCDFSYAPDDFVAIHGFFSLLDKSTSPTTLRIAAPFGQDFGPGSTLKFYNFETAEPLGQAKVVSATKVTTPEAARRLQNIPKQWKDAGVPVRDFPKDSAELIDVTIDQPLEFKTNAVLVDSGEFSGEGAIIRYNYLHEGAGRGIQIKASHSIVDGNRIERIAASGIAMYPESYYLEGTFPQNVEILNNTIIDCADVSYNDRYMEPNFGALQVSSLFGKRLFNPPTFHGFQQMQNIKIRNNHIIRPAVFGIFASNIQGLTISGNIVESPHRRNQWLAQFDLSGVVKGAGGDEPAQELVEVLRHPQFANMLMSCRDVTISGNQLVNDKNRLKGEWGIGPWTSNVTIDSKK
ncbi:MAG: right-handed parallel beta-helix repeat-containing protein [bacterium]